MCPQGLDKRERRSLAAWNNAAAIAEYNPAEWRRGVDGSAMRRQDYGDRASQYGWEIGRVVPITHDGRDALDNLRAPHRRNNARRGGHLAVYSSIVGLPAATMIWWSIFVGSSRNKTTSVNNPMPFSVS